MNTDRTTAIGTFALLLSLTCGCELRQAMYDQAKYEPLEASVFFADGRTMREPVEGTVARGQLRLDTHYFQGKVEGELATTLPVKVDRSLLERGQERFNIYCTPCHDRTGRGNGVVVQRGLKAPPSFHEERLRNIEDGHFFDVMTNGYGVMFSYASRIPVPDRWAIVAYIRALQYSQNVPVEDLTEEGRTRLQALQAPLSN